MVYIENAPYNALVSHLVEILRTGKRTLFNPQPIDDADGLHMRLHAALRLGGIDMGELVLNAPRIDPSERHELVEALAALDPDAFTGNYEPDQIKVTLGEEGNIWPASIRVSEAA